MTLTTELSPFAQTSAENVAFVKNKELWSYGRLASEVERLGRGLVQRGIRPGDRIALHMANLPELVVAYYACFRIGAIAAPLNTRFKTAELRPLLQRLRPALYIGQAALYSQVAPIDSSTLGSNCRFIVDGAVNDSRVQPWKGLFAERNGEPLKAALDTHAPAVLLTTSGTTGQPKFVTHTLATLSKTAESLQYWDLDSEQISTLFCPMAHASGLFTMVACLQLGAPFVLIERFDPDAILDAIERHRCTWVLGLPFMFAALVQQQQATERDVNSLRTCLVAGDVCPARLQEQFLSTFGAPLRSIWASTEASGSLTYSLQSGQVTRIARGAQVRLVDDHDLPVPRGQVGELVISGAHVTLGYWAGPGQIIDARKEGWYHTGDLMRQDNKGDLWFVSRKKHLIIRGGSNISPVEVERVLMAHPAVRDAAVVGVPDPDLGERVAGIVQFVESARSVNPDEILDFVTERLADYKVPETLEIVEQIPRNTLGKIDRQSVLKSVLKWAEPSAELIPVI
jgi:acyl-CoA synthetase (AMP-forming)/AMP-acid ligase II